MGVKRTVLRNVFLALFLGSGLITLLASNIVSPATPLSLITPQAVETAKESPSPTVASTAEVSTPVVKAEPESDATDCEHLPKDHPVRLKLNGTRLRLDYNSLEKGMERSSLSEAKVRALSDGRLLVGLGDTLYMLDAGKRIEWRYTASWLWDFAVVESTGMVYGTGGDNIMFILDASTGRKLYGHGRNGKFAYGQVVPFGEDLCLITDNLLGYRDALDEWKTGEVEMIETDGITAWRGTEALWSLPFPPDAELVVSGDRIFAVTRTDKSIYVRQINPPKTNGRE